MTFEPPPPPPPPPGWQPSGGQPGGQPGPAFDAKNINPLDWGILAAGVLAFVLSFVSYYSYSVSTKTFGAIGAGDVNAWHGFFGWFAMLCALAGSAVIAATLFAPAVKLPTPARLSGLAAYALGTVCVILALFVVPGNTSGAAAFGVHIDKGHGVGYWLSLVVIVAGLVLSLMRLQQEGGQLPGALNNLPNLGAYGPGQHGAARAQNQPPMTPPAQLPPENQPPQGYPPPQ